MAFREQGFLEKWNNLLKAESISEEKAAWRKLFEIYGEALSEEDLITLI